MLIVFHEDGPSSRGNPWFSRDFPDHSARIRLSTQPSWIRRACQASGNEVELDFPDEREVGSKVRLEQS
jgi:hypothetical protein